MPEPRAFVPIGRYVEDWTPGDELITPGRTYTDADLSWFARWMGTTATTVMDESHLTLAVMFLIQRLGIVEGTGVSNLGSTWTFHRRVYAGDTIWVRIRCVEARPSRSLPDNGIAGFEVSVENQRDEVVATVDWSVLILRRGDGAGGDGAGGDEPRAD